MIVSSISNWIYHQSISQMMRLSSVPMGLQWEHQKNMFANKEEIKSIGNPAGIGKGTGFGLRDRDRDGIGLGHYRLRASTIC